MRTERCSFKLDGLHVHFRPWSAVSNAYNADLHFRVHEVLDGLPPFAWWPEIVYLLVERKCAVQRLDDGFTTMEDTSSFGMWVWMPSPHRIPKVLWCTLVNKAPVGLSSRVRIEEDMPDQWKRGMTFKILLHIDQVEGFIGAPVLDGGEPISDFRPASHTLPPCHFSIIDGLPVPANWDKAPGNDVVGDSVLASPIGVQAQAGGNEVGSGPALAQIADPFLSSVDDTFDRPQSPLLPRPVVTTSRARRTSTQPPSEVRRNARMFSKPKLHAIDKSIHVHSSRMGIDFEGMPLTQARKEYPSKFKSQLPTNTLDAIAKLSKLNIRSMTEADEALVAMGGPGGLDPVAQGDVA
ncbi:hypothetical protein D1007_37019 [Hordeum vulgare]|nr:hypothetical protein D1007_37019 [Hordeum vulgare]